MPDLTLALKVHRAHLSPWLTRKLHKKHNLGKVDQCCGGPKRFPAWVVKLFDAEFCVDNMSDELGPHPDLAGQCLVVVGHHGYREVAEDHITLDASGGRPEIGLEAMLLPAREVLMTLTPQEQHAAIYNHWVQKAVAKGFDHAATLQTAAECAAVAS